MGLERNLEKQQDNLRPPAPTFANFFTEGKLVEAYNNSSELARTALATQRLAQRQFRETYQEMMGQLEDMITTRPAIRKHILGQASEVTKTAEMAFQRGQRNIRAYTASNANRTFVGERMGILAKSKEQEKQRMESSLARERIREGMARRQLYRAVIQRQNESIQAGLSGIQSMAQQQGGIGMSGLQTALGGMLSAGAGITGLGLARGSNLLAEQATGLGLDTSVLSTLTDWRTGDIGMNAGLDAIKIREQESKASNFLDWAGSIIGGVSSGIAGGISISGVNTKEGGWASAKKGSEFVSKLFGG